MTSPSGAKRILHICGSINQTRMLDVVARELPGYDHFFTPYYADGLAKLCTERGWAEMSIAGRKRRGWCLEWLRARGLPVDLDGARGGYDLVVTSSDVIVPRNVRGFPLVAVQEGILDPERVGYWLCKTLPFLPRWVAGTALTGQSGLFDFFCAASEGYRDHFVSRGADPARVVVTGIPNFDDCARFRDNSFPHRGYVLVCTSDARETLKFDFRKRLIRRALRAAGDRQLIFKLHPNENVERATREIREVAPRALVFHEGNAEEMIANCELLITQWSSTAFVGIALGKEVVTNFDLPTVRRLCPVQNGGTSARNIARVCLRALELRAGVPDKARPAADAAALERTEMSG